MNKEDFLSFCTSRGYAQESLELFRKALAFAERQLKDKKRLSGDSFFSHNVHVGVVLAENRASPEVIAAGILHGIFQGAAQKEAMQKETTEELKQQFGEEIYAITKGVEEIRQIKVKNQKLKAEALRRILLATIRDVRIILVKLANKLENMKDIQFLAKEEQQRIAQEALDVYAPLAYRLGVEKIRTELEDHALAVLQPKAYHEIATFLKESQEQRTHAVADAIIKIQEVAENMPLIKIKGRPKHIYSIYKKLHVKQVKLAELYDLFGIRILVPTIEDCYSLLGKLHEHFQPIEGHLKDYIANPKPNMYQSLHTALRFPNGKIVEVQIRTPEMDEFAEEGIAAHWRYKGMESEQLFEKKMSWLKSILDLQKEAGTQEFLEAAKVDVFGDEMYCYTPKGDVKELPKGATVLDFAYTVHEQVGNHATGARVNGKFVPLKHELASGDVIEIITHKNQRPHRSWLKIMKSARSRQKIRKSLKDFEKLPSMHFRQFKPEAVEEQGVLVEAEEFRNAFCTLAKCCHPLPGDAVAGIATKRRIISVHSQSCRAARKEQERWISTHWKETFSQKIRFFLEAKERSGLLADALHTIATAGFEVKEARAKLIDVGLLQCSFLVVPRDLEQVKELVRRVQKVRGVMKMFFE